MEHRIQSKKGTDGRCLVTRSGIIYYEYSSIISSVPQLTSEDKYKEAKFEDWLQRMALANRPDDWVCTLSLSFLVLLVIRPSEFSLIPSPYHLILKTVTSFHRL
jgi:hypothetical protein